MHLPDSLLRQPSFDDIWFFLTKFSQLLDSFLTIPKMIRLMVYTSELIHCGNTLDNKQGRQIMRLLSLLRFS